MATLKPRPRRNQAAAASSDKVGRWVDLLAAMLQRSMPATFEDLAGDIPAYASGNKSKATLMRMFERDKDELRGAGIPIETVAIDEETTGYRLRRRDFYLPYLDMLGQSRSARVKRWDYQGLVPITLSPDDADILASAARRVAAFGGQFAKEAQAAAAKMAFDLPDIATRAPDARILNDDEREAPMVELLSDAVHRRKRVRFRYRATAQDTPRSAEVRDLEPYGLFFLGSHWYVAGRDAERNALRNFRVSRMLAPQVNRKRAQSADFEIPADFDLRAHARAKQPWELGDAEDRQVVIELVRRTGDAEAAGRLGAHVSGHPARRRFSVRRPDAFARWLLSFAGELRPVEPAEFVERFRLLATETLKVYRKSGREK